jgi:drug/metabolite transporter (DMT)-like permease
MFWIPITVVASGFQVARNAAQRSLLTTAGPWGATLVRFLFGLPFSIVFAGVAILLVPGVQLHPTLAFWLWSAVGAAAQICATATLLVAMHRSSFAIGTAFQQSGLPFSALFGLLFFHDHLPPLAWVGVIAATVALMALSWPKRIEGPRDWSAAWLGTASGAAFAFCANAYRQAGLTLDPAHAIPSALATVVAAQAMQSLGLTSWLAARRPAALRAALESWRISLGAGFFGAVASGGWFSALAMAPAGLVRAVGVTEMPFAAIAGRRLFAEKLTGWQWFWGALTALSVALAAVAR